MQEGKKMTFNDDTYSSVAANNSHHITKQKLLDVYKRQVLSVAISVVGETIQTLER